MTVVMSAARDFGSSGQSAAAVRFPQFRPNMTCCGGLPSIPETPRYGKLVWCGPGCPPPLPTLHCVIAKPAGQLAKQYIFETAREDAGTILFCGPLAPAVGAWLMTCWGTDPDAACAFCGCDRAGLARFGK